VIAIEVDLIANRYVASSYYARSKPEWPPHPARLFSALVATAFDDGVISEDFRLALHWLERQGPPHILASEASERTVIATYVPTPGQSVLGDWSRQEAKLREARAELDEAQQSGNAKAVRSAERSVQTARKKLDEQIARAIADDGAASAPACAAALKLLPASPGRQPRTLPSVTPLEPRVGYVWPDAVPDEGIRAAIGALTARLVRLGHSSSLVSCRVTDRVQERAELEVWTPCDDQEAEVILRTVESDQLANLERAFQHHRGVDPRTLPARQQGYRRDDGADGQPSLSVFGEWIALREIESADAPRIGVSATRTEDVTRVLRSALLHHADDPPPSVLSGHTPDGGRLEQPHVAFLALPDVGSSYASGRVLGAAIVLPREILKEDRRAILRAIGRWEDAGCQLTLGRSGVMRLERIVARDPRTTFDRITWGRPARRWATVTPIALDENPGDLLSRDPQVVARAADRAEELVAQACARIDLPMPTWVQVTRRSWFDAAPAARRFMPYPRKQGGLRRVCVHAELFFDEKVSGPLVLGAGRYFGLGLCRPIPEERDR
jgi:CRISPR-associated protein Csb2